MQTIVILLMYQTMLMVLSLPCTSYAKVSVKTNEPSLAKSEQKLLLPQYLIKSFLIESMSYEMT